MRESRHTRPTTSDWSEVFAALPLEVPPADAWAALSARIQHRFAGRPLARRRQRWAVLAATLAVVALVPLLTLHMANSPPAFMPKSPVQAGVPLKVDSATMVQADAVASRTATEQGHAASPAGHALQATGARAPRAAVAARPREALSSARVAAPRRVRDRLEALYIESAQLEAALTDMQQPMLANGGIEVSSQRLAGAVGAIDAVLAVENLGAADRRTLWQQRNNLLVQMLALEVGQQRLISQQIDSPFRIVQVN